MPPRRASVSLFLALVFHATAAQAQAPLDVITRLAKVRTLSPAEADRGYPVGFEGTVLIWDPVAEGRSIRLFVHDGETGAYVIGARAEPALHAGQMIRVRASTSAGGFAPCLSNATIELLEGAPHFPAPRLCKAAELPSSAADSQWIEVVGLVRAVSVEDKRVELQLAADGVRFTAKFATAAVTREQASRFIGAEVSVRGVCYSKFTRRRQMFGIGVMLPDIDFVRMLRPSPVNPFDVPERSVDELLRFRPGDWSTERVRVRGVVTLSQAGQQLFIRDGTRGLMVQTNQRDPLTPGDEVEVAGFPAFRGYSAILEDGMYRRTSVRPPEQPRAVAAEEAQSGEWDAELVSMEAVVGGVANRGAEQELSLHSGGTIFRAVLSSSTPLTLVPDTRIRASGICAADPDLTFRQGDGWRPRSFRLLLRTSSDLTIVAEPSWWTARRIAALAASLVAVLAGAFVWVAALHRQVRKATTQIREQVELGAVLEERNRIARDIHDTLAQGFVGAAFQLEALDSRLQDAPAVVRRHLERARSMVRHGLAEARRSVVALRGQTRDSVASLAGLRDYAELLASGSRAALHWETAGAPNDLPPLAEVNLVRIAQEAIANALRHADAANIWVRLSYGANEVALHVIDDGRGFDSSVQGPRPGHYGLIGIEERAREMGGRVVIAPRTGGGTEVLVEAPCKSSGPSFPAPSAL